MRGSAQDFQKRHVLVFDEDAEYARLLKRELVGLGFGQVTVVATPEEALRTIRDRKPDLLVCELYLPFIRFLRTSPKSPNRYLPVVVSTDRLDVNAVLKARDAGINSCVTKPVSAAMLQKHVGEALAARRDFVDTAAYVGPDRRRMAARPPGGEERRGVAGVRARLARLDSPVERRAAG